MNKHSRPVDELRAVLQASRNSFIYTGLFSAFINLLLLVPALYMLQVYDRVLASGSAMTLLVLTLLVVGLYAMMGALELVRSRILVRVSARLDMALNGRLFAAMFDANLRGGGQTGIQPIQDLTALRQFLTGHGLFGFFDAPWIPVYMAVLFLMHPMIGWLAVGGALILIGLAIANELTTSKPLAMANRQAVASNNYLQGNLRNAEALESMGMLGNVHRRWLAQHVAMLKLQSLASDRAGLLINASKTIRITLQSLILGVGAYLAIQQIVTPGVMIAGSILMGRALAPIDMLINSWKGFLTARTAYDRLRNLLQSVPARAVNMRLPDPTGQVSFQEVVAAPPGSNVAVLKRISFEVEPGEVIGVIGPSAAGKSTLARVMLGVWPSAAGAVRLDGAEISRWNREDLGPHIGYLPQDIELFDGTVSENIARFGTVDAQKVVAAAQRAGVHEMILGLPKGYDTPVGVGGAVLSGGQRQRIGLARAMYGQPVLVVLDEPNSNLDEQGEAALVRAIAQLKSEGSTVFIITHRPSVLNGVDKILVLREGMLHLFAPREQVLPQFARPTAVSSVPGTSMAVG
ncbi:type I secretion system permease/ATPase [Thiocystis violascens]|uniref:Type I secretion system ABC transporter, PrtD family n=1 Tax=Thiocystis violascens (strain ATCC 17096 / DSM 198 / 6111) TaxID=765911 RepID=I3YA82_THIV6|nr:type I secretion system permease/ATPase [Thiocystis violascens]AFL73900.1 type I secretion system ABC transporter, PrtD family [Thiocystis violascens DSM 198]